MCAPKNLLKIYLLFSRSEHTIKYLQYPNKHFFSPIIYKFNLWDEFIRFKYYFILIYYIIGMKIIIISSVKRENSTANSPFSNFFNKTQQYVHKFIITIPGVIKCKYRYQP